MLFFKSASKLLVTALMGTTAMGELTKVPRSAARDVVRRSVNDDIIDMCNAAGEVSKRALEAREDKTVRFSAETAGKGDDTIHTGGLGPCQGVAVTGTYEDSKATGNDRFLAHVAGENMDPLDTLLKNVKEAQDAGLKDVKATIVYLDPDSIPEEKADEELGEFLSGLNEKVIKKVKNISDLGLFGPDEKEHEWKEIWQLGITKDKKHEASKQFDNPDAS